MINSFLAKAYQVLVYGHHFFIEKLNPSNNLVLKSIVASLVSQSVNGALSVNASTRKP